MLVLYGARVFLMRFSALLHGLFKARSVIFSLLLMYNKSIFGIYAFVGRKNRSVRSFENFLRFLGGGACGSSITSAVGSRQLSD